MGFLDFLSMKKKPLHKLKWKLPEVRLSIPIEDAEQAVYQLRKAGCKFVSGGEFIDTIHAKSYGEGVNAYFIVRVEKKTETEKILFDGYMIQEEEPLGMELTSSFTVMDSLEKMGYNKVLQRELTEWRFNYLMLKVSVFSIGGFADFVEIAMPAINFENIRKTQEKTAYALIEKKLGFKKEDAIPIDVITLQIMQTQQAQQQLQMPETPQGGLGGEFKLGQ